MSDAAQGAQPTRANPHARYVNSFETDSLEYEMLWLLGATTLQIMLTDLQRVVRGSIYCTDQKVFAAAALAAVKACLLARGFLV